MKKKLYKSVIVVEVLSEDMFMTNHCIPIPRGRVVRWFGDHAKLIAGNLK